MRGLTLVVALLSVPAFAADYTPWPGQERAQIASESLELAQQGDSAARRANHAGIPASRPVASVNSRRGARVEQL